MSNEIKRFELFGSVADEKTRKRMVHDILYQIQHGRPPADALSDAESENFASAIQDILYVKGLHKLCRQDAGFATKIAEQIINDFIEKTKKELQLREEPFQEEQGALERFRKCSKDKFEEEWKEIYPMLAELYDEKDFNLSFYDKRFKESLSESQKENEEAYTYEHIKAHFIKTWEDEIRKKKVKEELEYIHRKREEFCDELYRRIENVKKLQKTLKPFMNELGRLWDMSKGHFKRVDFNVLNQYSQLLEQDEGLIALAEMLGRMRQAEKKNEEELFTNTRLKTEWIVDHASKADLIGIRESDDLSSMLASETALLADETLEYIFFKKYAEDKLQTYDYEDRTPMAIEEEFEDKRLKESEEKKGPIIICVDTSGSMHGAPETIAKTLCFALLKIAIRDNRKCYLISFSTRIETLNLTDLNNSLDKIVSFLSMSFNGGTDALPAMREALRMLDTEDYKKADVIMVSDFIMPAFDRRLASQIQRAKDNQTKFHSLVIGYHHNKGVVQEFDHNWFYDINDSDSLLTLVKNINTL